MGRLFNKDFLKFSLGFIGMIFFGLLGILLTGYLDLPKDAEITESTQSEVIQNVLSQ